LHGLLVTRNSPGNPIYKLFALTTKMIEINKAEFSRNYFEKLAKIMLSMDTDAIARTIRMLESAWENQATVFIIGNGGSAATASHMANDFSKTVLGRTRKGRGMRAISLTDNVALMTAWANDHGYDEMFAGPLAALAAPNDILISISGSGNSPNLVKAVETAKSMDVQTIGFLGMGGGALKNMVDIAVIVPSQDYEPIEDVHMVLDHLITTYFRGWLSTKQ
jgi:D-sedoheptulose 7-phosphate isomerase